MTSNGPLDCSRFFVAVVSVFLALVSALYSLLALGGHTEAAETATYFLGFSVVLVLTSWISDRAVSASREPADLIARTIVGCSMAWAVAALVILLASWNRPFPAALLQWLLPGYAVLVAAAVAAILVVPQVRGRLLHVFDRGCWFGVAGLLSGPAAAMLSLYFMTDAAEPVLSRTRLAALATPANVAWTAATVAALFVTAIACERIAVLRRVLSSRPAGALQLLLVFFVSSLFIFSSLDGGTNVHYSAFVGPAVAVNAGRFPMTEVVAQYGTGYLVYSALFPFLPRTPGSIILITQVLNLLYMVLSAWIICAVTPNRVVGVAFCLFYIADVMFAAWQVGLNAMPSLQALRYLPPYLVLLSLAVMKDERDFSALSVASSVIAALWSADALVASLAAYLLFISARRLRFRARSTWRPWSAATLRLLCVFVLPHLALAITGYLATGKWPDYPAYAQIVQSHAASEDGVPVYYEQATSLVKWSVLVPETFLLWTVMASVYAVAVALALRAVLGRNDVAGSRPGFYGAAGIVGICAMAMFVGRSIPGTVYYGSGTFYILLASLASWTVAAFARSGGTDKAPRIARWSAASALLGMVFPRLILIAALLRSEWPGFILETVRHDGTLPYARIWADLSSPDRLDRDLDSLRKHKPLTVEGIHLLNKYAGGRREVLFFAPDAWIAMYVTNHVNRLGIANGFNDLLSARLRCRALRAIDDLQTKETAVIFRDIEKLFVYDQDLVRRLFEVWQVSLLERSAAFDVYALEKKTSGANEIPACSGAASPGRRLPGDRPGLNP